MSVRPHKPRTARDVLGEALSSLRKLRTIFLAAGLALSVGALAYLSWLVYEARRDNRTIVALERGDDIGVDVRRVSGEVMAARLHYLLARDRIDEAQVIVDASSRIVDAPLRARLLYNHANARVRQAIGMVGRGHVDKAIPVTTLAKDEYRLALRLDPAAWDIKHNYDVAMRIVRDFPGYEREGEEVPPDAPKRLWTDLPGVPRGAP